MANAIPISDLPDIRQGDLDVSDDLVINDVSSGAEALTKKVSIGSFTDFVTELDLVFTGDVIFTKISPHPINGLDIVVDNITINESITINPVADISGIQLDDLDDVEIDFTKLDKDGYLVWDPINNRWVNESGTLIQDAPNDGKIYARQNGLWIDITECCTGSTPDPEPTPDPTGDRILDDPYGRIIITDGIVSSNIILDKNGAPIPGPGPTPDPDPTPEPTPDPTPTPDGRPIDTEASLLKLDDGRYLYGDGVTIYTGNKIYIAIDIEKDLVEEDLTRPFIDPAGLDNLSVSATQEVIDLMRSLWKSGTHRWADYIKYPDAIWDAMRLQEPLWNGLGVRSISTRNDPDNWICYLDDLNMANTGDGNYYPFNFRLEVNLRMFDEYAWTSYPDYDPQKAHWHDLIEDAFAATIGEAIGIVGGTKSTSNHNPPPLTDYFLETKDYTFTGTYFNKELPPNEPRDYVPGFEIPNISVPFTNYWSGVARLIPAISRMVPGIANDLRTVPIQKDVFDRSYITGASIGLARDFGYEELNPGRVEQRIRFNDMDQLPYSYSTPTIGKPDGDVNVFYTHTLYETYEIQGDADGSYFTPMSVDGYYPLYNMEEIAQLVGNGQTQSFVFNNKTYYMPAGVKNYLGDYVIE